MTAEVQHKDCQAQLNKKTHVEGLMTWAQAAGKATGIVTTDR